MIKSHLRPDRKYFYAVKLIFRLVNQTHGRKKDGHNGGFKLFLHME